MKQLNHDTLLAVREVLWEKLDIANQLSTENHQSGLKQALNLIQEMLKENSNEPIR